MNINELIESSSSTEYKKLTEYEYKELCTKVDDVILRLNKIKKSYITIEKEHWKVHELFRGITRFFPLNNNVFLDIANLYAHYGNQEDKLIGVAKMAKDFADPKRED